jgi:hypothetical protein
MIRIQVGSGFNSVCGFGSRKAIKTLKKEKKDRNFYEELDILPGELEVSSGAWKSLWRPKKQRNRIFLHTKQMFGN